MKRTAIPLVLLSLVVLQIASLPFLSPAARPEKDKAKPPDSVPTSPVPMESTVVDRLSFATKDGKIKGWKAIIIGKEGSRALATPAVVDDTVFIGGGFGSHEFYA